MLNAITRVIAVFSNTRIVHRPRIHYVPQIRSLICQRSNSPLGLNRSA
jgi:hypothetical protein